MLLIHLFNLIISTTMNIEQIYTGCLAQGAYYITSKNEAVVIDPLREVQPYVERAEKDGVKIKYIFETHFHADFVSGHLDLQKHTGATIVYGPNAKPGFDAHVATDSEEFKVGDVTFVALHTPGHTMESTCYLLRDKEGNDKAIFTGDTLFIGDVGRPDLAQKISEELTQDVLAGHLYDSLNNKIMPLSDDIIVYPAHGAGSACGKNMSKETTDTLGNQKKHNYALQPMEKEEFIKKVTDGLTTPPSYFPLNVMMNIQGYESFDTVKERGLTALKPEEFEQQANESGALLLDTRHADEFEKGFIPNSINIGIDGSFAPWVGAMIKDVNQPLLIIADKGREEEVVTRLSRVGFDNTIGYLKDGFDAWKHSGKEVDTINSITVNEFAEVHNDDKNIDVVDVRKASEYEAEHIVDATNVPLDYINENFRQLDKDKTYYVHCAGGYRSMIFVSILKARGYENLVNIKGGFKDIKESEKFELTKHVDSNTKL